MRKFKKVALALVLFMSLFTLTGCKERTPIDAKTFQTKMESKEYTIYDSTDQFIDYSFVKKVLVAVKGDYQIEYFIFEDEERAKNAFEENKSDFDSQKGSVTTNQITVSTNNYDKYHLVSNGKYMSVSRIGNTMIFANVDASLRDSTLKDIEDLGY